MLRAVRGATTVEANTIPAIHDAVAELLQALVESNDLTPETIAAVFFTVTPDLTAISVAKVARLSQPWQYVPLMCAQEPLVNGLPTHCVRVMIQFDTDKTPPELNNQYLKGAQQLRPDLANPPFEG
jgi:chorismate mutase